MIKKMMNLKTPLLIMGVTVLVTGCASSRVPKYNHASSREPDYAYVGLKNVASIKPKMLGEAALKLYLPSTPSKKRSDSLFRPQAHRRQDMVENISWETVPDSDATVLKNKSSSPSKSIPDAWDESYALLVESYENQKLQEGRKVVVVEPVIKAAEDEDDTGEQKGDTKIKSSSTTKIRHYESKMWPSGKGVSWHLGDDYTGLRSAWDQVGDWEDDSISDDQRVRVAHLDTGYNKEDTLIPKYFNKKESVDFLENPAKQRSGESTTPHSHGVRTLSTLAGGKVTISSANLNYQYNEPIGANPFATVVEYRINKKTPIHFSSKRMARAIEYAAESNIDVISLSHGGFPSIMQRNSINNAYDRGVAVFAATGDFFTVPFLGIHSPKTVVFPARYSRVMGVAGVTAAGKSYGDADCYFCLFNPFNWFNGLLVNWGLRGSYGPEKVMTGHTMSAFAPNITHSVPTQSNTNQIDLTGSGTSHATPQVAGAAALWLQKNRSCLEANDAWDSYKKAEMVYQALMESSNKGERCSEDSSLAYNLDYSMEKLGEGVLRAKELMDSKYACTAKKVKTIIKRETSSIGFSWITDVIKSTTLKPDIEKEISMYLINMLQMELEQIVMRSKKMRDLFSLLNICEQESCRYRCKLDFDQLVNLLEAIRQSDYASEFLKKVLAENIPRMKKGDIKALEVM